MGRSRLIRLALALAATLAATALCSGSALAAFPYGPPATSGGKDYRLPDSEPRPSDLGGKLDWMYSATPGSDNAALATDARELNGVRGAHLVDKTLGVGTGWQTSTGRPEVAIATLDSGIKWNDPGAMADLRKKVRLNKGELPVPEKTRTAATEPGQDCNDFHPRQGVDPYDLNGDGVFNVVDYACDSRVDPNPPKGVGPPNLLDPQDILIAFSNGKDEDHNGYVDDIVGWDFLDNDNDPFDDVQYGHGTGESRDSTAEANNGGELGACPNCMVVPMRVGDSFIADVNRFAQAVTYAVDNDVLVVQEALGTLNNSTLARQAVDYAYNHGVTVIASAADEAAQHNNWPSSNPHVILVNSVTKYAQQNGVPVPGSSPSYLSFNGCTNFNAKITLAIPSVSCSSDATGRASGMAGLVYSAALNAREKGRLAQHPTCKRVGGDPCLLSANEVRQLMASGTVDGTPQADDVDFAQTATGQKGAELACPTPGCTDPFAAVPTAQGRAPGAPAGASQSYPARAGHDQFYGYGRVNMDKVEKRTDAGIVPPEAEIASPDWYSLVDPGKDKLEIRGHVGARGNGYTCQVLVAPGSYPGQADFQPVGGASHCDGSTRSGNGFDGVLGSVDLAGLKQRYPPQTDFTGPLPKPGPQTHSGRPNPDPYGFVVKVVVKSSDQGRQLSGEDERNLRLHRDAEMVNGFPRNLGGDGASSPLFVDLNGDNRNELVIAGSDGFVHAYQRDGSELPGWPVRGDPPPLHTGSPAFKSGEVTTNVGGAILASVSSADLNGDGSPEVVAADLEGKVYVWSASGERLKTLETELKYSGKPLQPFENVRYDPANPNASKRRRTQHGIIGSPVLADLDGDGRLEIIVAGMDRHVYAWHDDGSRVQGFPVLVVDRSKVTSIDPTTHAVTFNEQAAGDPLGQGAIVDTPAVADIGGPDKNPEIVVGTNEEYKEPVNAANFNGFAFQFLGPLLGGGNGRLYAIKPTGTADPTAQRDDFSLQGWPVKIGLLQLELLPIVGEGVTGSPIVANVDCGDGEGVKPRIGVVPDAGPGYILKPDGTSCFGQESGKDVPLATTGAAVDQSDAPVVPAVGHPAFGNLDPATGPSFVAPATGLKRALDVVLPEYQGGQDFLAAWTPTAKGQLRPNFPVAMNDLQFLTGPSIGDIDPNTPGEEIVSGSASLDLAGYNAAGAQIDPARWPKLTSDWMVANPLIGSWGELQTDPTAKKVVFAVTRAGFMLTYRTAAQPCSPSSWPRFHHDNASSGDYGRDAVAPGKPMDLSLSGPTLSFKAPGDDLLCGKADHYEIVTSDGELTPSSFGAGKAFPNPPKPEDPGKTQQIAVPVAAQSIAIRAVDKQGNRGRVAVISRGSGPSGANPLAQGGGGDGAGGGAGDGGRGGVLGRGRASRCLPRSARLSAHGLGPLRLGDTSARMLRRAGAPARRRGRAWRYCIRGGGRALVAFSRRGRAVLIASTGPGHRIARIRPGTPRRALRRAAPGLRGVGPGVGVGSRRHRNSLFGLRRGRVRFVAVADRALIRQARALARYVKSVGV